MKIIISPIWTCLKKDISILKITKILISWEIKLFIASMGTVYN